MDRKAIIDFFWIILHRIILIYFGNILQRILPSIHHDLSVVWRGLLLYILFWLE